MNSAPLVNERPKKSIFDDMFRPFVLALFLILTNIACDKEKAKEVLPPIEPCDTVSLSYTSNIGLILSFHCSGTTCHINATVDTGAGILLSNYDEVIADINKPGSCFLTSIQRTDTACIFMPRNAPRMNQSTIDTIKCWIANGAGE